MCYGLSLRGFSRIGGWNVQSGSLRSSVRRVVTEASVWSQCWLPFRPTRRTASLVVVSSRKFKVKKETRFLLRLEGSCW